MRDDADSSIPRTCCIGCGELVYLGATRMCSEDRLVVSPTGAVLHKECAKVRVTQVAAGLVAQTEAEPVKVKVTKFDLLEVD